MRKIMADDLLGSGLNAQLSGVPVMQLEIRNAVKRDGLTYNILGILAGCIIAIIFFRKISFMIVAAFPPIIAILLALGGLGWAGFNLNMFLNVMTPLIMVISFSDSMQLTFAARDRLIAGQDKFTAFKNAVLVVGPACVLTHGTAGISFIALQFSNSDLIRKFGEAGLAATIIALIAVLSLVPVFGVLFVRNEKVFAVKFQSADAGVQMLRNFCYWIAVRMVGRPGLFSLIAVFFVGGLAVVYANLEPRYRLADRVPDKQQAVGASGRLACRTSRLRDRGHRPFGDRRAQLGQHDREAQPRVDGRIRAGRDFHRISVPFLGRDVRLHPARHFPGSTVGYGAVCAGRGAAICKRGRADGIVRPWPFRDDPLSQPVAAGEQTRRYLRGRGRARDR